MVSREDVIAAYRLFLEREPESEQAVRAHMESFQNLEQLRQAFFKAPEFRGRSGESQGTLPIDQAQAIEVEVDVGDAALERLLARVEECWSRLGREEPYWSVLSGPRFRMANFAQNEQHYQGSGESDLLRLLTWLERNGVDPSALGSLLEFGCGTGRVTRWLCSRFPRVVACDISEPHLILAQEHLERSGCRNVEFRQVRSIGQLGLLPEADLIYCVLVLQHNPPPVIALLLRRLLACLTPGGLAFFQVPTYARDYRFRCSEHLSKPLPKGSFEMHVLPQRDVFAIVQKADCDVLEVLPDGCVGNPEWISNTFLVRRRVRTNSEKN